MLAYRGFQRQLHRWITTGRVLYRHDSIRHGVLVGSSALILGSVVTIKLTQNATTKCEPEKPDDLTSRSKPWPSLEGLMAQLNTLSERYSQIASELSGEPGSLYQMVVEESTHDYEINPELRWKASVRVGNDIGLGEKAFMRKRKQYMRVAFAKLIGVNESLVDERDVPVVGIAASGGGYRAMVSTTGSLIGARNSGLLDVTSYIAGISGSCWALGLWYSLAAGNLDHLRSHMKSRITTPFLDLANLQMFVEPPTNKYLLSGLINKSVSLAGTISLVDIYGTLVSSRLYVPDDLSKLDQHHLKLSNQRMLLDGSLPLPIYCAIHHLLPELEPPSEDDMDARDEVANAARQQSFLSDAYHWYELTPFEVGSEDVGAFIPTWSLGRVFENGRDIESRSELSLPILTGIFASAFTASLAHYYTEAKPGLTMLPFFPILDKYVSNFQSDLSVLHPFPPAELPNFLYKLHGQLKPGIPQAILEKETIALMDAGAELNIPYVPLYRRQCDVLIALDASADSQDVWFSKAETYAEKCGINTWPIVKYPGCDGQKTDAPEGKNLSEVQVAKSREQAQAHLQKASPGPSSAQDENPFPADLKGVPSTSGKEPPLGRCNIWVGDSNNKEASARMDEPDDDWIGARNGPALIYIPLTPGKGLENPAEVWSTWRFDYDPSETEQLINLSEHNFRHGERQIVKVLRGIWKRKRNQRLSQESNPPN